MSSLFLMTCVLLKSFCLSIEEKLLIISSFFWWLDIIQISYESLRRFFQIAPTNLNKNEAKIVDKNLL